MNQATNKGTCQICGRIQKLPRGLLAKHGYQVVWESFTGTCYGSGLAPFEVSCDTARLSIQRELKNIEFLKKKAAEIHDLDPEEGVWVKQQVRASYGARSQSVWHWAPRDEWTVEELGEFRRVSIPSATGNRPQPIAYAHESRLRATLQALNDKRAQSLLNEVAGKAKYVAWQRERCNEWQRKPLLPLDATA